MHNRHSKTADTTSTADTVRTAAGKAIIVDTTRRQVTESTEDTAGTADEESAADTGSTADS